MIFAYFGNRFSEAKSTKNLSKNGIPKTLPKCKALLIENRAQDTSETLPRRPHDATTRFLSPFWGPTWSHVGPLFRPKTAPEAPRTPPKSLLGDVLGASWGLFTAKCQQEHIWRKHESSCKQGRKKNINWCALSNNQHVEEPIHHCIYVFSV